MRVLLPCLALLLAAPLAAQPVVRCEGTDGRVTYTNEPCPGGARTARAVDNTPAVQAQREAPARSAGKDKDKDKNSANDNDSDKSGHKIGDKSKAADRAPARPAALKGRDGGREGSRAEGNGEGRIESAQTTSSLTPAQQIEQLDQERARQRAQCVQLERRIGFARTDVDTALGNQRASAELQLRRLQDEHRLLCPAQR
ncbi:MAG: DUF4124 domain-containing protein [Burkholderiales bacterium]|jgi:hypothetical protein|nr:DUF4124 domain-containing protein [Burkholderiales bacterium]MCA3230342.1 DUF4124 domain-containing protein [Burkholderiales bacterium]